MAALDRDFYDELVAADGQPRAHARTLVEALETLGPDALTAGRPPPRRDLHAAGDHVRRRRARRRSGARPPVPARPRAADHPRRRVDDDQARPRAADPRAQPLRRRRLPRARDHPRRQGAVGAGRLAARLRPRRARHPPARRRLLPRLRLRPRARRRRRLEGARGQRPHAERHLLRAREPARDDAAAARPVRPLPRAARRPLPGAAADRAGGGRADRRGGGGHGRRLDARARSTPPTSSTRSWRARWASSSSRPPTSSSATRSATSAPPAACSACTRSTAGSTTTSWTRSSSGRTPCSASRG